MPFRALCIGLAFIALDTTTVLGQQDSVPRRPKRRPHVVKAPTATGDSAARDSQPSWPIAPIPLPGSILPARRIVAFYGNPLSRRMGILALQPADSMLSRLDRVTAEWTEADSATPAQPALHLIAVVAQGSPGRDKKYRQRADSALIERVYGWAKSRGALLFLAVTLQRLGVLDRMTQP